MADTKPRSEILSQSSEEWC